MKSILSLLVWVSWIGCPLVVGETEYFPGLRRPPHGNPSQNDERSDLMERLTNFIEEQARRRFHEQRYQLHHQQQQQGHLKHPQRGPAVPQEITGPGFSFVLPPPSQDYGQAGIPFAVDPSDPRYYENSEYGQTAPNNQKPVEQENEIDDYEETIPSEGVDQGVVSYYKPKSPMHVNPKILDTSNKDYDKANQNNKNDKASPGVFQKPLNMESAMGLYIIALIAGMSAAVIVGLMAVGIAFYTLKQKSKMAADVEYPAYGVTGPNKDNSPNSMGDKKLAQSAQMYHYQHQKQQIIAMENRSGDVNGRAMSDVESDDENEEGDYTVYECPGLAPTGEMEVKNPLFLDDPTPATPAIQPKKAPPTPPADTKTKK